MIRTGTMRHLILALLLSACGNPDGFDVPDSIAAEFDLAAGQWCEATSCCPYRENDGRSQVRLVSAEELDRHCSAGACWGTTEHHGESSVIEVLDGLSSSDTTIVLLHELGHHCGCHESTDKADAMYPGGDRRNVELTEADRGCAR